MTTRAHAIALAGGGLFAAATGALGAQTLLPVRVGTSLSDPFLEPFYAQDQNFFTAAGINAEVQALSNGNAVMAAILGGSLDTGNADLIQLANAANRGADVAIIASGAIYDSAKPTTVAAIAPTQAQ